MSGEVVYLDSSAFLKLVRMEAESAALQLYLRRRRPRLVSSRLLAVEALRATMRVTPERSARARRLLRRVAMLPIDGVADQASALQPPELRSLDAIHLASALSFGPALGALLTYDARMASAAARHGLVVACPR